MAILTQLLDGVPEIVVLEGDPVPLAEDAVLFEEELQAIARSVQRRQQEYKATRLLARQGFARLGLPQTPLLNAPDRSPLWPAGVVGTITHTHGWCGVALAEARAIVSLGMDVESREALASEIAKRVLTEREWAELSFHGELERRRLAKLIFSAKESIYKAQYPRSQQFLGFEEVEVQLDLARQTFSYRFLPEVAVWDGREAEFEGRFRWDERYVATCVFARVSE